MIKQLESIALVAVAMFILGGTAQAGPEVSLIWRTNGTDTIDFTADGAGPHKLDVVLSNDDEVGVGAVTGVFVSILFDLDGLNELNAVCGTGCGEFSAVKIGMGNTFTPLTPGVTIATESSAGVTGIILGFDQSTTTTGFLTQTSDGTTALTLGSLSFTANVGFTDGIDVIAAVLPNGIDAVTCKTLSNCTGVTTFNGAQINGIVPEPTTALLVVLGLGGLAFAGRRSIG